MTKEYGVKFDFRHFKVFEEHGIDTWHFQMIQDQAKKEKLMKESKEKHHHEVAINHILNDPDYIIENN